MYCRHMQGVRLPVVMYLAPQKIRHPNAPQTPRPNLLYPHHIDIQAIAVLHREVSDTTVC